MPREQTDILQGTLDLLILKIVALGPAHGYRIAKRIQQISDGVLQVQQGSLYPALHRLENLGCLQAKWMESETGREAKFYKITVAGRRRLESDASHWDRVSGAVSLILQTAE